MSVNRRRFLGAALGAAIPAGVSGAPAGQPRFKADLFTPALLLDLDVFESNVKRMADHYRQAGIGHRPHAKTHKCPEIARRQVSAGALGVCLATVPEAEAMAAAGIRGLLLTSPIVEPRKIDRVVQLNRLGNEVMLAVGHAREVQLLGEAAATSSTTIDVLIDLDIGDRRTGILPGPPALELARQIGTYRFLRLRGLQAYAGHASHVVGFDHRRKVSREAMARAVETKELLARSGFAAVILSGGSTGTYNIDSDIAGVTELQVGSYIFMDVDYRRIGGQSGAVYTDFQPSLSVLTTVVSTSHADRVTVDAGTKALATDVPHRPEARGRPDLVYSRAGDEFGTLSSTAGPLPALGDRLEFIVPHCDPTVNLYDRIYALRGDRVEDVWPILARKENVKDGSR
jgi:D-serine deaminase-like pyridoxal phosphate-dependent protein